MPDLAALTDGQRDALAEFGSALDMYRQSIEQRMRAERAEEQARRRVEALGYDIAGVG